MGNSAVVILLRGRKFGSGFCNGCHGWRLAADFVADLTDEDWQRIL